MVADAILMVAGSPQWNKQLLKEEVPPEVAESIISIPIPLFNRADQLVWHYNSSGAYTVKSGYHVAFQEAQAKHEGKPESSFQPNKGLWKAVWGMKVPSKVKSFWWMACTNSLATKENLAKRKCSSSGFCPICDKETETVEHTLFHYTWVKLVWFAFNIYVFEGQGRNSSTIKWASTWWTHYR